MRFGTVITFLSRWRGGFYGSQVLGSGQQEKRAIEIVKPLQELRERLGGSDSNRRIRQVRYVFIHSPRVSWASPRRRAFGPSDASGALFRGTDGGGRSSTRQPFWLQPRPLPKARSADLLKPEILASSIGVL